MIAPGNQRALTPSTVTERRKLNHRIEVVAEELKPKRNMSLNQKKAVRTMDDSRSRVDGIICLNPSSE
jgi:hypothetical protein